MGQDYFRSLPGVNAIGNGFCRLDAIAVGDKAGGRSATGTYRNLYATLFSDRIHKILQDEARRTFWKNVSSDMST